MRHTKKGIIKTCNLQNIGKIFVAISSNKICKIGITLDKKKFINSLCNKTCWSWDKKIIKNIPKLTLDLSSGTDFQQKIWKQIKKIPKGKVCTYTWLAQQSGRPKAIRAAANACGKNPIPLIIPCHRVIRSDGTIGGFSGPKHLKKTLLNLEGLFLTKGK